MGLAACDLTESPQISTVTEEIGACDNTPFLCANSPGYLHGGMHELSLLGTRNVQGYRLELDASNLPVIRWRGLDYRLDIVEGELRGMSAAGTVAFAGPEAKDAELHVVDADTGFRVFDIVVKSYRKSTYQVGPPTDLHLYVMEWRPVGGGVPKDNACNAYAWPLRPGDVFEGMTEGEVLMFAGDRFYPQSLTLASNPAATAGWITFGCAGHALAKLDLSGNTRHRQMVDDWAGRQATLKLYVADYCGDGKARTIAGTPLLWRGPTTEYPVPPLAHDLEARWGAGGATCVLRPRMAAHPDPMSFTDVLTDIRGSCPERARECLNTDVDNLSGRVRISANYFP